MAFGRRLDTRTRHGGDGVPQSPKRGGRITGHGKRLHPVDPPFAGPAARAIQKKAPDRPSCGTCVRRHRVALHLARLLRMRRRGAEPVVTRSPPPLLIPIRTVSGRGQEVTEGQRARKPAPDRGRPSLPSLRQGGVAPGADIAILNLDDGPRALPRIRAGVSGRSVKAVAGRLPGTLSDHSRGPLTLAAANPLALVTQRRMDPRAAVDLLAPDPPDRAPELRIPLLPRRRPRRSQSLYPLE